MNMTPIFSLSEILTKRIEFIKLIEGKEGSTKPDKKPKTTNIKKTKIG